MRKCWNVITFPLRSRESMASIIQFSMAADALFAVISRLTVHFHKSAASACAKPRVPHKGCNTPKSCYAGSWASSMFSSRAIGATSSWHYNVDEWPWPGRLHSTTSNGGEKSYFTACATLLAISLNYKAVHRDSLCFLLAGMSTRWDTMYLICWCRKCSGDTLILSRLTSSFQRLGSVLIHTWPGNLNKSSKSEKRVIWSWMF